MRNIGWRLAGVVVSAVVAIMTAGAPSAVAGHADRPIVLPGATGA